MRAARLIYALVYLALLYAPILPVVVFSFNDSVYVAFPLKEFTLRWYRAAADNAQLMQALWNSAIVSGSTMILSTLIGLTAALATTRYRFRGRTTAMLLLFAPLALPTVVIGVALLSVFMLTGLGLSLATVVSATPRSAPHSLTACCRLGSTGSIPILNGRPWIWVPRRSRHSCA